MAAADRRIWPHFPLDKLIRNSLITVLVVLGLGSVSFAQSHKMALDPKGAYILTNQDSPDNPLILSLSSLGIKPGDEIAGIGLGDLSYCPSCSEMPVYAVCAVFSSSDTLLSTDMLNRIPGAIAPNFSQAVECVTSPTLFGNVPTDIPQDFALFTEPVTVPPGAKYLFVALPDTYYADNTDNNGDLGVQLQGPEILNAYVDNSTPAPSIISDPFYQQPTTINVTAYVVKLPDGETIDFSAEVVDLQSSAGHDHTDTSTVKIGEFGMYDGKLKEHPIGTCQITGGTCSIQFTVAEVSGSYQIIVKRDDHKSQSVTVPITVGVPSLQALSNGSTYKLTGAKTGLHVLNHTGTQVLETNVQTVAKMYFNNKGTSGQRLGINDMSLPVGGLFDISGAWQVPHKLHRTGNSVDIDHNTFKGGQRPPVEIPLLVGLMKSVNPPMYRVPEVPIHFQVSGNVEAIKVHKINKLLPLAGKITGADILARVTRSSSGLFTYSYAFTNSRSSTAPIASLRVDLSRPTDSQLLSHAAVTQGTGSLVRYEHDVVREISATVVPAGLAGPTGWVGTLSVDRFGNWFAESEPDFVGPGENASGFRIESLGLPGIRTVELSPYLDVNKLGLPEPASELSAADYEFELESLEKASSFSGSTIGPTAPPLHFDARKFLRTIELYASEARQLGWISTEAEYQRFQSRLGVADSQFGTNSLANAKHTLNVLLDEINSSRDLSPEAEALLSFNIQYLVSRVGL
jgi:hypothetical protein